MKTIVIAPHPDDEVLGCGGTLFRRKSEGAVIAWVIVTTASKNLAWDADQLAKRQDEIEKIKNLFGFSEVFNLEFPSAQLDQVPTSQLVGKISEVFGSFQPEEVFVPHRSDIHTDHRIVFDAVASCCKWFRYPSIKRVLAYETLSETDFGLGVENSFLPNVFVNIEKYLPDKLSAMKIYQSEMGDFPFPRSLKAVESLASVRGVAAGYNAAEAFQLLRERI